MRRAIIRSLLPLAGLVALVLACGPAMGGWISTSREIRLGRETARELEKRYGLWREPEAVARVERIGMSLVPFSGRKLPYSFKILGTSEVNAVAAPGGFVYLTKGLVKLEPSDDEVAFVLGHEIAHAARRHAVKQLERSMGVQVFLAIITRGRTEAMVGDVMRLLWESGYSKKHEFEADDKGLAYATKAGYDPYGGLVFLRRLKRLHGGGYKGLDRFFGTHPAMDKRISRLERRLEKGEGRAS